jgi:single-strand DNA-binding protein
MVVDPELRLAGESPYCRFRVAVNRGKDKVDFFNVVAWNKTAEFATEYFKKGERLIIHGTIRNADYIDKDGKKQYAVEILADRLEFVETLKSKEAVASAESESQPQADESPPEPPEYESMQSSVNDDDLPS